MIKFKEENGIEYQVRLEIEFHNGIDKRLGAILLALNLFTETNFNKSIIITCLNRTVEENSKCGGSPYSSHLDGRGADIRSRIFSEKDLALIEKYLYNTWGKNELMKEFIYVLLHGKGNNRHLHISINYKFKTI